MTEEDAQQQEESQSERQAPNEGAENAGENQQEVAGARQTPGGGQDYNRSR